MPCRLLRERAGASCAFEEIDADTLFPEPSLVLQEVFLQTLICKECSVAKDTPRDLVPPRRPAIDGGCRSLRQKL